MKLSTYKKGAIGLLVILCASCTRYIDIYRTVWQENSVVVDGKPAEWSIPLKFYDEKSRLQYTVSNDRQNLYICIRATDPQTQTKVFRAGMQIWIDTTGKNEHFAGIMFPLPNAAPKTNQPPKERGATEQNTPNTLSNKYGNSYKEMELFGFGSPVINGIGPIQSKYGISACINWDSTDIMTYEAIIPFNTFYKASISGSDSTKRVGVSIVLNALSIPQGTGEKGGSRSGSSVPGGGGGGMHGGGGHGGGGHGGSGGGGGGSSPGSSYMYESNSIKTIFQLSVKKRNVN